MKAVPPPPSAAVFAFPGLNYTVEAVGTTDDVPAYPDCVFMWKDGERRAEVHVDSIETMQGLGWALEPVKG